MNSGETESRRTGRTKETRIEDLMTTERTNGRINENTTKRNVRKKEQRQEDMKSKEDE